ncbi:hypothetical protein Ais01nite_41850 [Asanoa ishikariensis]|uniref:PASTA domain-containing protein n=1 Tax=Asanoa ishikariensis TaxID=137265 RepID=A0A1H3MI47_9ACTN|nr:PASTA domain-containing protein [Asanoa ishikariensis]GIF66150.1 hypothetical protein Ais01nite_41850 [Asanoa ishikariensis]SDY76387.1 PASTA domain-containing protein [Asanoa ishikariensis]
MSGRSGGALAALTLVATTVVLLAACATPSADSEETALGDRTAPSTSSTQTVPDLIGQDAAAVDKLAAQAGVVPMISYDPGATGQLGTVVRVDPPPGTAVALGDTIEVAVAGKPGGTLDELVAADRRNFVGLTADPDGTFVIGVIAGPAGTAALRRLEPALAGRKHRVVRCTTTWAELSRLAVEIGQRADLRASKAYAVTVEPAECAVLVEGDITDAVMTALRAAYADRVVVKQGPARRAIGS